jgi:hypothetical protein
MRRRKGSGVTDGRYKKMVLEMEPPRKSEGKTKNQEGLEV